MIEKIMTKNIGRDVKAGDEALFSPDLICAYDYPGYIDSYEKQLTEELGMNSVKNPEKFIFFIDHFNPAGNSQYKSVHVKTRNFAKKMGIRLYENVGIGHQVLMEKGYVTPGKFIIHFDGHVNTLGALGAYAINVRNSMIEAFATQEVSLVVPDTLRIDFVGKLRSGVAARDLFHTLVAKIGPSGANGCCIEYGGEGLKSLSLDSRFTICNQSMFLGAITAIMEVDDQVEEFLKGRTDEAYQITTSDSDANYIKRIEVDLSSINPVLVEPPSPANTVDISKHEGLKVDVGYIGSCASGRMEDFYQALEILEGKKIKDGFRLEIVPSSVEIQREMARTGVMEKLIDAGACVYYPSCDFCFGILGVMTDGEVALSTGTLNIPGRKGNVKSDIYIASPYTIAASALTGTITDPRKHLNGGE